MPYSSASISLRPFNYIFSKTPFRNFHKTLLLLHYMNVYLPRWSSFVSHLKKDFLVFTFKKRQKKAKVSTIIYAYIFKMDEWFSGASTELLVRNSLWRPYHSYSAEHLSVKIFSMFKVKGIITKPELV